MTEERLRLHLKSHPLYRDEHRVNVVQAESGGAICAGWRLPQNAVNYDRFGLDFQIERNVFYLLTIHLTAELRGRGLGFQMYQLVERIAKDSGCREVRQTPSGRTPSGESRASYLMRRLGYRMDGEEAVKAL